MIDRPAISAGTAVVLAKSPVPGRVKTRLVPPLTYEEAASVAAAALLDTIAAVSAAGFSNCLLSFDSPVQGWLPEGWKHHRQPGGGLDERIVSAVEAAGSGPVILVGMDTPQLTAQALLAFDPVRFDACLGPAYDGGYWAIGFADGRDAAAAVSGVPMSRATTGADQLARLQGLGLRVQILDELADVDTIDVAIQVGAQVPTTHFSNALNSIVTNAVA